MTALAQRLLQSQALTHQAACAERLMRQNPALDTPQDRAQVADAYAFARHCAGAFAVRADYFESANEPCIDTP